MARGFAILRGMTAKGRITAAGLVILMLAGLVWVCSPRPAPAQMFRGRLESDWIAHLAYRDDEQVKQWRGFGPEGARVLVRGLDRANRPLERAYRKTYRAIASKLPFGLARLLPAPRVDSTRETRMKVVSLLSSLGNDAGITVPAMGRAMRDENPDVCAAAISFFTSPEDEHTLLNQLDKRQKRKLLPSFIEALQNNTPSWSIRNNAALALRYYPEEARVVAPVLAKALQDPIPRVRVLAAAALLRVDADTARKAGAARVAINILRDPDDQVAYRAAELLGEFQAQPELAVPALIECLRFTNELVGCQAVWSLGKFRSNANLILPALQEAAQRKDNVAGHARAAVKRLESEAPARR
jgi:hypothetical protein